LAVSSDNSSNATGNTCLSSLASRRWSVEARVFHVIDDSEIELRPVEIARKIHAPRKPTRAQCTTVRVLLRKLLEKGLVLQPYEEVTAIKSPTG
jgi:predicted transcriptional regulator